MRSAALRHLSSRIQAAGLCLNCCLKNRCNCRSVTEQRTAIVSGLNVESLASFSQSVISWRRLLMGCKVLTAKTRRREWRGRRAPGQKKVGVLPDEVDEVSGVVDVAGLHAELRSEGLLLVWRETGPLDGLDVVLRAGRDGEAV